MFFLGEGATKGETGKLAKGRGRRRGKRRGDFFLGGRGGIFAIYTNKIGDCLFIYLFVYLSICSAIGGQTARPKRLKFGG